MALKDRLALLHDSFTAFIVGDVAAVPERAPAPYRLYCRAVVVWLAIVIGVAWVILDPLLFHGALADIKLSFAITDHVVFEPSNPYYVLENRLLQQVASTPVDMAGSSSGVPQCSCVYASGRFTEPSLTLVVEEFGHLGMKPAKVCTNATLELFLPSYVTTDDIDPAVSALLREAVRLYCLLVVHSPVTKIFDQPSHVMLSSSQWAAMQYLAIAEHLETRYLLAVNHFINQAAFLDTLKVLKHTQAGVVSVLTMTLLDIRTRLLCSVPGVNITQMTVDSKSISCTSFASRRVNLTLTYDGLWVDGFYTKSQDPVKGYELYRIWCAPRSCVVIEPKGLYKRAVEFLGLLGGLFAIWRFVLVTCIWNACCRSALVVGQTLPLSRSLHSITSCYCGTYPCKCPARFSASQVITQHGAMPQAVTTMPSVEPPRPLVRCNQLVDRGSLGLSEATYSEVAASRSI